MTSAVAAVSVLVDIGRGSRPSQTVLWCQSVAASSAAPIIYLKKAGGSTALFPNHLSEFTTEPSSGSPTQLSESPTTLPCQPVVPLSSSVRSAPLPATASRSFPSQVLVDALEPSPVRPGRAGAFDGLINLAESQASAPEQETNEEPDEGFEIDPESDPLQSAGSLSEAEWEESVRKILPRKPIVEDPQLQRQKVTDLLERIRNVSVQSDPASLSEAESLLLSLPNLLRDPDQFVAGAFTSCHAAWTTLLENSKRKSAKTVLAWLKNGVKPQFVGTADAKDSKRALVIGMLKRQGIPEAEIPHMLSGDRPHPIIFDNHKSFYDNWDFVTGEASKLVLWSAASVVGEGEEMPLVILPLGVVFTGGRGQLIVNGRYCNLFMKQLPFRYKRLRDILGFTKEGYLCPIGL